MDLFTEHILELIKIEPGSGLVNSILLILIWLNVRGLKKVMTQLEQGHETRLNSLEVSKENHEGRLRTLETGGNTI